ncbi:hypothetical protein ACTJLB_31155 [Paraburkholderia sp. 22098]|uniref:hypothetical protein n=1 Tax=Paraburkholderia sp. 22098 TaxID=3453874 RepID=UPI003F85D267
MAVLVGLFAYYRDAAEALGALEALGLAPGNGHLYQKSRHGSRVAPCSEPLDDTSRAEERAEYAAHGDYLNVCGASNHFSADPDFYMHLPGGTASTDASMRTLLIVTMGGLDCTTGSMVLYDYGAMAVRDASGRWRFSPYRKVCHSQSR